MTIDVDFCHRNSSSPISLLVNSPQSAKIVRFGQLIFFPRHLSSRKNSQKPFKKFSVFSMVLVLYLVSSINGSELYGSWTETTAQATQNSTIVSMLHDKDCFAEKSVPVVFNIGDRKPTEELKLSSQ